MIFQSSGCQDPGPISGAELAIDEYFLTLLNEVPEILGGLTLYLEVHKSGDLLFFPLRVYVMLRCWRSRQRPEVPFGREWS